MPDGRRQILIPLLGIKTKILDKAGEKYTSKERIQNLAETDSGLYYNQKEWLEDLYDERVFYNSSKCVIVIMMLS